MVNIRVWVQLCSAVVWNPVLGNFISGHIYRGKLKQICIPALNCYSCPGAVGACPLGSLQTVLADPFYSWSFYVLGWLVLFGSLLGRWICGWVCPFGMIQEWLHRVPFFKLQLPHWLSWVKYAILAVFVIYLPIAGAMVSGLGVPAFCKYICPAGTLEAGLPLVSLVPGLRSASGDLFALKLFILLVVVVASLMVFRPFCRVLCPLGAIYGLFNPVSWYRYECSQTACVGCGSCTTVCKMGVNPAVSPNSTECIRCGDCLQTCPQGALNRVCGINSSTESTANE